MSDQAESTERDRKKQLKTLIKRLREERTEIVNAVQKRRRERNATKRKVRDCLAQGPGTVPEIARETRLTTDEVLWYVTAMKKYGEVAEEDLSESYPRYRLIEKERDGQ